jgi:glucose/mannose-6-phosphate isomerase
MKQLVLNFPQQLSEALKIGQSYTFQTPKKEFNNILLTGLGGSGIGGTVVQNFVSEKMSVPFIVNKDYFLPGFVNEKTLVIVSSYSGNTEETISAMQQAMKAKATVVCISSGGKIGDIAKKNNFDCIPLPGGMPPRSCLGYSMVQVLYVLHHFGYIKNDFEKSINAAIKTMIADEKNTQKEAKAIAKKLVGKTPIIYAASDFESVAVRFRQQINENSKMLAWHHVVPEMNHNEIVGWRDKDKSRVAIFIRNESDYKRTQLRMDINQTVIKKYSSSLEIWSKGKTFFEKVFSVVHLTDWVTVFLADLHGVDVTEVNVIDMLKGELAKAK